MRTSPWLSLAIACLVQGVATVVNANLGMLISICIAIYLASRFWFVDHPAKAWYDLLFAVALVCVALAAGAVYLGICGLLPVTGITTRTCMTLSFRSAFLLHLWMLGLVGGVFWLIFRVWSWWLLRKK